MFLFYGGRPALSKLDQSKFDGFGLHRDTFYLHTNRPTETEQIKERRKYPTSQGIFRPTPLFC